MIDLRSDTVTLPTKEMLQTILESPLGDSGRWDASRKGEDPTVNEAEKLAASLVGKEDAALCVSGTMGNLSSLLTFCSPGDVALIDKQQHLYRKEKGAFNPRFGRLSAIFYDADENGLPVVKDIEKKLKENLISLVCIENTNNNRGGICIPAERMKEIYETAHSCHVPVYMDGARLFNAAIALHVPAVELAQYTDALMFCVSKGLGAPIGSFVCGSKEFIYKLKDVVKTLGGSMRQAGVIAAPAIYAMKNNISSLKVDHDHAKRFTTALTNLKHIHIAKVQTNIVMLSSDCMDSTELVQAFAGEGVKAGAADETRVRLVFNRNISDKDVAFVINALLAVDAKLS